MKYELVTTDTIDVSGVNIIDNPMETLSILAIVLGIDIASSLS